VNKPTSQIYRGTSLPAGTQALGFSLPGTPDQTVKLSEFRGQSVVLAFYRGDWSPVWGDQMALFNEMLSQFQKFGSELLGVSVDGAWCYAAFCRDRRPGVNGTPPFFINGRRYDGGFNASELLEELTEHIV
jgi:alkyl hydroperoxide reductase subunit AhpC